MEKNILSSKRVIIRAHELTKRFQTLEVLKGINLDIYEGEVVSIVGNSGAGKTTLLQVLGTLEKPSSGSIFVKDVEVSKMPGKQLAQFRNLNMGFVFQFHHLLPEFTAIENVCMPAWIKGMGPKKAAIQAKELLVRLGLEQRLEHKPSQLSGGEQQRVAVARALMNRPAVVFADEPSGNLDSHNADELHNLFFELRKELNQTFVIVTHNPLLAKQSDRTLTLHNGMMV